MPAKTHTHTYINTYIHTQVHTEHRIEAINVWRQEEAFDSEAFDSETYTHTGGYEERVTEKEGEKRQDHRTRFCRIFAIAVRFWPGV